MSGWSIVDYPENLSQEAPTTDSMTEDDGSASTVLLSGVEVAAEAAPSSGKFRALVYEVVETILLAVIIWLAVNFATARYVVEGESMEPNLHTGQYLVVSRLSYMQIGDIFQLGEPQRGDIIVFDYPGNPSDDYVKRIIGLPGDVVTIDEDGIVFVNGIRLAEPYIPDIAELPYRKRAGTWEVPEGTYFVLGDNRNHSSDSRTWGVLDERFIVGKAWISYWPPEAWGFMPHYEYDNQPGG